MEKINPLQAIFSQTSAAFQKERAASQMTLGKLIAALGNLPSGRTVRGFGFLHSYRGYYKDLAFDPGEEDLRISNVGVLLDECRAAMGKVFQGYKGGDFLMGETTPLWIAEYGSMGLRLMGLDTSEDIIIPITAPEDDHDAD